jgi:FtsP/CotA-like multicopper oxidase with cupredoxin domain
MFKCRARGSCSLAASRSRSRSSNRLPEATAIHWHGMELESYYDGVHGWSGAGLRVTPLIEPGDSFVVRFTPPRTGTFMYHTHNHDHTHLASGLYGPMLVVEPPGPAKQLIAVGETYDFEFRAPPGRQTLWLEVRTPAGKWHAQGRVIVR